MLSSFNKRIRRPMLISICFGLIFFLLFGIFLFTEASRIREKQINRVTRDYVHFQDHLQGFMTGNINLMAGFSAYIQTFDQYDDQDVYIYLENLTKGDEGIIRNVGIIQDTTIRWVYPAEGNEKALGADLSKIPDQAGSIAYVKKNLTYHFDGPRPLIQGGTGYMIRMPILKDNTYWGMVSVVLYADKVQELFHEFEKDCNLRVAVLDKMDGNKVILGDPAVLNENYLAFQGTYSGNQWIVCVVSTDRAIPIWNYLLFPFVFGLIILSILTRLIYRFYRESEHVKERNEMLNEVAFRDRLTGIYNRSFLDVRIQEEISAANRYGMPLSMIYFDLDHFKRVNDHYGHSQGDAVLRELSQVVNSNLRASDIMARWGGEEFAILLPGTNLATASSVAEKIRVVVETIEHPNVGRVTASFGIAEYCPDEFAGSWFKRVDKALYDSKQQGRNRVTALGASAEDVSVQYRIKWQKEWNSGNKIIDLDHKEILRLGNELVEDSYTLNSLEESVLRYNELLDHIEAHFQREEAILKELNYDLLQSHKDIHHELMEKAIAFRDELRENTINAQWLFQFLLHEIILGHMAKEDAKFFDLYKRS